MPAPEPAAPSPLVPVAWAAPPAAISASELPPYTEAYAALVIDEASAQVLYEKAARERVQPASLTKIATAVVALERGDLDSVVTSDVDSRYMYDSTLMGLRPGDQFTLRDMLYGLMLPSGNDAALAIARHVSGNDAAFAAEMNALVTRLGLRDTQFMNPHGLTQAGHYSSAYDMALLARHAMTIPEFRRIVAAQTYVAVGSRTITMTSLIGGMLAWVDGADGVKSGFTEEAGKTEVFSALRGGNRVYAVVMNSSTREADLAALTEWAFANFDWTPARAPAPALAAEATPPGPAPEEDGVVRAARAEGAP